MVPSSTKAREDDGFVVFALQSKTKIRKILCFHGRRSSEK